ncbi:DUF1127 domain-containing protein [Rhizobium halophilum]|uniref:hypothetical protein n=1 Tax=Rhizobium halophilum TaxID=2846852 RepID=UPI001EFDAF6E|nr:hypothetical protein [Rhizobium halophilum]MCF6368713.1 hypothetical protein [Rhizobium halophilum]
MAFISQNRFGSTHSGLAKIAAPFMRLASRVQADWRQRQTERMLESLPAEIRKDIGWPSGDGNHEAKHIH